MGSIGVCVWEIVAMGRSGGSCVGVSVLVSWNGSGPSPAASARHPPQCMAVGVTYRKPAAHASSASAVALKAVGLNVPASSRYAERCAASSSVLVIVSCVLFGPATTQGNAKHTSGKLISVPLEERAGRNAKHSQPKVK